VHRRQHPLLGAQRSAEMEVAVHAGPAAKGDMEVEAGHGSNAQRSGTLALQCPRAGPSPARALALAPAQQSPRSPPRTSVPSPWPSLDGARALASAQQCPRAGLRSTVPSHLPPHYSALAEALRSTVPSRWPSRYSACTLAPPAVGRWLSGAYLRRLIRNVVP